MFCPSCGKELEENAKFCPGCGRKIEDEFQSEQEFVTINEDPNQDTAKCFKVFNKIGKILGIISISTCWIPFLIGLVTGVPGLVFSILGKRWKGDEYRANSKKGMTLSIVGGIISFITYLILIIIIAVVGAIAASEA